MRRCPCIRHCGPVTDVRYAVIGYGVAGSAFHAPLIATTPGARLTAVVARSAAARAAVGERYPGTAVVPDLGSLADLGIDVAVVATPNHTHAEIATALIGAGIAAVVDKPLATDVADAGRLIDTAEREGVALTCYQNRRWDGDFATLRRLVADGRLGRVHRLESRFERWRPSVKSGWKEQPGPGTGVLWDLGPHVIDQAIVLLGPVSEFRGWTRLLRADALVPDDAFVELHHESGAVSQLWVSAVTAAPGPRFRVLGDRAAYVKDGLDPQEDALRSGAQPGQGEWGVEPPAQAGLLIAGEMVEPVATLPGDYPEFYRRLTEYLHGEGALPVDPRDSLAAIEVIERVSAG